MGQLKDAEQYLSQAQWVVLQTSDCAPSIKSRLHRDLGLLFMAQGDGQGSKKHFAEDVSTTVATLIIILVINLLTGLFLNINHLNFFAIVCTFMCVVLFLL